jgi:hypothetical protein
MGWWSLVSPCYVIWFLQDAFYMLLILYLIIVGGQQVPKLVGRGISSSQKRWQPILRIKFACNQWDGW